MADGPANVLCVCTGNVCRSPAIELSLKRAWGTDASVTSAGTYALTGWEISDDMFAVLAAVGLDGTEHEPRQLDVAGINSADMIIVAGVDHRNWIVQRVPEAAQKVFLLTEMAALTDVVPRAKQPTRLERIAGAAALFASARSAFADRKHEDILDPYDMSRNHHEQSMRQMSDALSPLVTWIGQ